VQLTHRPDTGTATSRITARREAAGDKHIDTLPDDPAGMVAWVCAHRNMPAEVLAADALDALAIIRALRVTLDRQESSLLSLAREAGVPWQRLAVVMHLKSRQAAEQRARRLEAMQAGEGRSERAARARHANQAKEASWLTLHHKDIRRAAQDLSRTYPAAADGLAEALKDPASTPRELVAWMSVTLTDLNPGPLTRASRAAAKIVGTWHRARGS
jgi:hypothetical protein